ncbi:MAG TPA: GNAT family N-acetyltransferase [Rhizomicrobium sp.]|jgi:ribosomal protein S18 acetylase RimI-like enzyme
MIAYRTATPDDADTLAEVHRIVQLDTYVPIFGPSPLTLSLEQRRAEWNTFLARGDLALVATADGAIVGFSHATGPVMETLYVLPAWHRHGIGRALFNQTRAALAERGLNEMTFNVLKQNDKAVAFYRAMGAHVIREELKSEPECDTEDFVFAIATRS